MIVAQEVNVMGEIRNISGVGRFLITAACFVIVIAGVREANSILVPFLLSIFIAIICSPPLYWMQRKGIPNVLAVLLVLTGIIITGSFIATFVGTSVNDFSNSISIYQERLSVKWTSLLLWLNGFGIETSKDAMKDYFDPGKAFSVTASALTGLSGLLTNVFMILLTVVFILLEVSGFSRKLNDALNDPEKSLSHLNRFIESVNRYLALKTFFSLITGIIIWIWLYVLGVDYALLWGLVAFLLNYIPNIGSIIAAVPAILLALIQLGSGSALLASLGYIVTNIVIGSFVEPKFMGRSLGLSTLIVFLSLVFWGWVLGPVGMLLSVPLTMIVKIALESNEDTRWIAVLMG